MKTMFSEAAPPSKPSVSGDDRIRGGYSLERASSASAHAALPKLASVGSCTVPRRRHSARMVAALLVSVVSCVASQQALADDCEVKIGSTGPLSGGGSDWGLAVKAGAEFGAAMANEAGGLQMGNRKCKVKVLSFDSQATAAGGAAASNYFASEEVGAVIGPIVSSETTGFKPVAKRNKQVNFSSSFATDVIGPAWPLAFAQVQAPQTWGPIIIKKLELRFNFKSMVVVAPNDQGGTDPGKALARVYTEQGIKAAEEYYQRGTTNFAPIVARVMGMHPDTVEIGPMPPGEAAILVKQLLEAGYTGAIGRLGTGASLIVQGAGGPAALKNLKAFYWLETAPVEDKSIQTLRKDFERLMKRPAPDNALFYTSELATEQVLRAISLAGTDSDGEKIAAELRKMTPESRYLGKAGWRGKSQYGINQQLSFPVGVGVISNGTKESVTRVDIPAE